MTHVRLDFEAVDSEMKQSYTVGKFRDMSENLFRQLDANRQDPYKRKPPFGLRLLSDDREYQLSVNRAALLSVAVAIVADFTCRHDGNGNGLLKGTYGDFISTFGALVGDVK